MPRHPRTASPRPRPRQSLSPRPPLPAPAGPHALSPLSGADIAAARLTGELACSFAARDGAVLLHAAGNVASRDPAVAIVRRGDGVRTLRAPGGFDAILRGATFRGEGIRVRIAPAAAPAAGGESPPLPATLDADGRTYSGNWTCGP